MNNKSNRRTELENHLTEMKRRYTRFLETQQEQTPQALYLKQCIEDLSRELGRA